MKRVALVTGSSRGIGKAIALRLAKEGFTLILHGREKSEALESTFKAVASVSPGSLMFPFDVGDRKAIEAGVGEIKKLTSIDTLILNAGITRDKRLVNMSWEDWDLVRRINLDASFHLIKLLLPSMIEQKFGRIIAISSIIGEKGNFGQANYAASKAGLVGLVKSLAKEVGKEGVTVNAVSPGFIETEMTAVIPEKYRQRIIDQIPMKRLGKVEEVASLVNFLASEEAGYINGGNLRVDGGWA
jgi:3-oxoacyl-[acyl-carrier protein] reductase